MAGRRSGRSKTKIDYSKFGGDDDFDDDFADMTPPANKRSKTISDNKENNLKKVSVSVHEKKKKERPSLDEKLYERELKAALELSMTESQQSPCKTENEISNMDRVSTESMKTITQMSGESDCVATELLNTLPQTAAVSDVCSDEIVVLDLEKKDETNDKRRSATMKKPKSTIIDDDGSDFDAFSDEESDEDDDDYKEDSSDFEGYTNKKVKGKTKEKMKKQKSPKEKQKTPTNTKQKTPAVSKQKTPDISKQKTPVAPKSKTSSSLKIAQTVSSPSYSSQAGGADHRKWVPPGISSGSGKSPLGGISIKSPSSGLRVGLSRNQKLKPLHPTLKIHH